MNIVNFLLAYSKYGSRDKSFEEFTEIFHGVIVLLLYILLPVVVIVIIFSVKDISKMGFRNWLDKMFSTECRWCKEKIPYDSIHKKKVDGYSFCGLKCSLKYANTKVDLLDKAETIGKSTNININDRNKYLD